ncbi:acyl-homoserine-lactone synthase [Roseibium litorale]|uniref:Acyl-homoserine-lactone synthase n=1 Tax=Roseibium litorale TaxID=2803841 RepID=A0ABR9CT46_9HYPH|nr:acyl-homoserine-lactone synthase [Roseibium litorale]MBD8894022.1 hypothetical protein [Roseibium litorale]
METVCLTWETAHLHGDFWYQHHQIRKALFVDSYRWSVPHNNDVEWDCYDNPNTRYVLTHVDGRVIAASRFNPCSFDGGTFTYMIRDAALGRLPSIPRGILENPPIDNATWEATRFSVDPTLAPAEKNAALSENARAIALAAKSVGAQTLIALMQPAFVRWLKQAGLQAERIGPILRDDTGSRICVIQMHLHYV